MKIINTLLLSCFLTVTMSLTGCFLTTEEGVEEIDIGEIFSDDGSFGWGGGSIGGEIVDDFISGSFGG